MFWRILVALNFTDAGIFAMGKGVQLASIHNAELHVFHSLDYHLQGPKTPDALIAAEKAQAGDRFEHELRPMANRLSTVRFRCHPADPALETCRLATLIGADLILLGAHRYPGKASVCRVGYVGTTILENAPCPVLFVPYGGTHDASQ